jgi:hypothetical protein
MLCFLYQRQVGIPPQVPEPLGPRPSALATLHKQFQLVHRASQRRHAYRSRLVQPQVQSLDVYVEPGVVAYLAG